ncbi:hypothetical protein [Qipengyuania sp. DGS5-3]|uniref:hypothetical protein n=1 Tax=Qipengyuania sp. DGS5-3 TaxID=3349632 RepID=UPI0036D30DAE
MHQWSALIIAASLAGCVGAPSGAPVQSRPVSQPAPANRPAPAAPLPTQAAPSSNTFIAPQVLQAPGLRGVIGSSERRLTQIFGPPRLNVREGDALKLQFRGRACVLDVFLYPLQPSQEPSATHVEARRASDGQPVNRGACVAALRR